MEKVVSIILIVIIMAFVIWRLVRSYIQPLMPPRLKVMDKDGNRLTEPVYSKIEALNEHLFSFYLLDGETQFVKSL